MGHSFEVCYLFGDVFLSDDKKACTLNATNATVSSDPVAGYIPAYTVFDAGVTYRIKRYSLKAGMNNIANKKYFTLRADEYPRRGIAFPLGIIADKFGLKKIFLIGLTLFALVYFGMSVDINRFLFFTLFAVYGVCAAATEGISKAWISNISDKKDIATAIGTYSAFQSICTMRPAHLPALSGSTLERLPLLKLQVFQHY